MEIGKDGPKDECRDETVGRGTVHSSPFPSQYGLEHSMHSDAQLDIPEIFVMAWWGTSRPLYLFFLPAIKIELESIISTNLLQAV